MPFERPRIEVFQEFKDVVVSPAVQEFSICLIGPCYDIYDYVNDKSKLAVGKYVKAGKTKDAPGDAVGLSTGRPDAGLPFITLSEPPQFRAGSVLDPKSVYLYFDEVLIDIVHDGNPKDVTGKGATYSDDTGVPIITIGANSTADLSKIKPGDRIVVNVGVANAIARIVKSVNVANKEITLTSYIEGHIISDAPWRVERLLSDVEISQDVISISDNTITINVPSTGILAAYEDSIYVINYAEMYIEYRSLRTDLQKLTQINNVDEIQSTLGILDERNPLAVGAYVALSNAGTPIYVYGVNSDSLVGHAAARDFISSNKEIYAIIPLSDSLNTSDWLSVINLWKQDCEKQAQPERSRFRIVVGSLPELPTYKNSVDPSTTGSTMSMPNAVKDVFITSMASPPFSPEMNYKDALLDVFKISSGWGTLDTNKNIFDSTYQGAKTIKGVIGSRRLRVTSALSTTETQTQTSDYFVRHPILASEGGATILKNISDVTAEASGSKLKLSHPAFKDVVLAGDIIQIITGDIYKTAYYVDSISNDAAITTATYTGGATSVTVNVYRLTSVKSVNVYNETQKILYITGGIPPNVGVGDVIILLERNAETIAGSVNVGVYLIREVNTAEKTVTLDTVRSLSTEGGGVHSAVFVRPINADGNAAMTSRARLTHLKDNNAQFMSTVEAGELIEIPYPERPDLIWDTTKNRWPIAEVINDQLLRAQLTDLEELAPKNLTAGFNGDCPYRIAIGLNKSDQVKELKSIVNAYKSMRLVMCWPHAIHVSGIKNRKTGAQNYLRGQYLACAVGGQVAANPPQQGFTFLPISAITKLYGSSFYLTDDQLTELRNSGWYVFVQDTEISPPYSIHAVTTDVSAYEFGELMHVKDFDYVSIQLKNVLEAFKGRYNITANTIEIIRSSLLSQVEYLKNRSLSRLGPPLIDATLGLVTQSEADRLEIYMELELPHVLNRIGLHLAV